MKRVGALLLTLVICLSTTIFVFGEEHGEIGDPQGFRGFSWGAHRDEITANMGKTVADLCGERIIWNGIETLGWDNYMPVSCFKADVHISIKADTDEMVCGQYKIANVSSDDCTFILGELKRLYGEPNADPATVLMHGCHVINEPLSLEQAQETYASLDGKIHAWDLGSTEIYFLINRHRIVYIVYIGADYIPEYLFEEGAADS